MFRPKILISACLLGHKVRYDGGHKLDQGLVDWLRSFADLIPVCPETESGLPVPREPMHLEKAQGRFSLVTNHTRTDHTEQVQAWISAKVKELQEQEPAALVLKGKSPSCGVRDAPVGSSGDNANEYGPGLFAQQLMAALPKALLESEDRLQAPLERENFRSGLPS